MVLRLEKNMLKNTIHLFLPEYSDAPQGVKSLQIYNVNSLFKTFNYWWLL